MIPRTVYHMFGQLDKMAQCKYNVRVSHVELYNEVMMVMMVMMMMMMMMMICI
jgi:hypothetical protein